ncbi:MAG: Lrp/AsnC family transcriptional regulator [Nanoarchaeota archaeon]|nr:Lrp/AsnC family transcriptional regulator [Nanoarchaeota archaeon]
MNDPKKQMLLNILRKDCRVKKADIARSLELPVSTVSCMIKKVEKELGLRYVSLIDYRMLGHGTRTSFVIDADSDVLDMLSGHENINSIYRIDDKSYFIEAIFKCMKDMADFADALQDMGAKIKKEFYIIEDLKREEFGV